MLQVGMCLPCSLERVEQSRVEQGRVGYLGQVDVGMLVMGMLLRYYIFVCRYVGSNVQYQYSMSTQQCKVCMYVHRVHTSMCPSEGKTICCGSLACRLNMQVYHAYTRTQVEEEQRYVCIQVGTSVRQYSTTQVPATSLLYCTVGLYSTLLTESTFILVPTLYIFHKYDDIQTSKNPPS